MKIGAHVSTAGRLSKSIARAAEIGCEAIQIFGSSPQGWAFKPIPEPEIESFRSQAAEAGIDSIFLHAIYLSIWELPTKPTWSGGSSPWSIT